MSAFFRLLRRGLALLILLYALLIGGLQLLWRTPALNIWWVQLLNVFGLWLYLPLPCLLLLVPLARPRAVAVALAVPLSCFGWEYAALFMPERVAADGTPLRVLSWNVLFSNHDIAAIDTLIRAHRPDVVALQELSVDQSRALQPLLDRRYPYRALAPGGPGGLGVWSRFPILDSSVADDRRNSCACQRLIIEVSGQTIRFVNAHPFAPRYAMRSWIAGYRLPLPLPRDFATARQEPAIDALVAMARAGGAPLIIAGDLNTSDRQANYWRLRRYLQDAYRAAGRGFGLTFPHRAMRIGPYWLPSLLRIDYILYSAGIEATRAFTVGTPASDHRRPRRDGCGEGAGGHARLETPRSA